MHAKDAKQGSPTTAEISFGFELLFDFFIDIFQTKLMYWSSASGIKFIQVCLWNYCFQPDDAFLWHHPVLAVHNTCPRCQTNPTCKHKSHRNTWHHENNLPGRKDPLTCLTLMFSQDRAYRGFRYPVTQGQHVSSHRTILADRSTHGKISPRWEFALFSPNESRKKYASLFLCVRNVCEPKAQTEAAV